MKKKKCLDYFIRLNFLKLEINYYFLKKILHSSKSSKLEKRFASFLLQKLGRRHFFLSKVKNYSVLHNSSSNRSVSRFFKISRWELKSKGSFGLIKNLQKSSW